MKTVVIIGAGPAGLTAGYELLRQSDDYQVIILEESDMIGGLSRTVQHNGHRMDIGGHRFFSKNPAVTKWWNELLPIQGAPSYDDKKLGREKALAPDGPDPEAEDRVMLIRQRVSRIYYKNRFFDYPVSLKWDTIQNMGLLTTIKAGFSYLKAVCFQKPEDSLENFYINRFGKVLYSMFFEGYTQKLWGRHPSEISADWGAQRVKGLSVRAVIKDMFSKLFGGKNRKVETSLIEEFIYPKLGPGQLWETAADEIVKKGGMIKKNCPVKKVCTDSGRITAVVYEENGRETTLNGDYFLSSMPVKDLIESIGDAVPEREAAIAAGLPYRDFVTVGLLVEKLNLENKTGIKTLGNIVPDCWIYVQDVGVRLGRIQIFNNWSPYLVKDAENTVWIGLEYFCEEGDDFWNLSDEACIQTAVKELCAMGVISEDQKILDSHREKIKKAYPAYFDTYGEIDTLVSYLDTFENLYCVGRNGQHRYNNMDHSMATSFEAVKNIINGAAGKENVWNVNTDREYLEETS